MEVIKLNFILSEVTQGQIWLIIKIKLSNGKKKTYTFACQSVGMWNKVPGKLGPGFPRRFSRVTPVG